MSRSVILLFNFFESFFDSGRNAFDFGKRVRWIFHKEDLLDSRGVSRRVRNHCQVVISAKRYNMYFIRYLLLNGFTPEKWTPKKLQYNHFIVFNLNIPQLHRHFNAIHHSGLNIVSSSDKAE